MKKFITVLVIVGLFITGSTPALSAPIAGTTPAKDCPGMCTLPDSNSEETAQSESEQRAKSLKIFLGVMALFLIIAAIAPNDGNCDHEGHC